MEVLIRWEKLLEKIRPYYPSAGKGRVPYPPEQMLRVHCVQLFYKVSDPGMEDMLYEVESVRRFTGIRLEKVPDETTILNFRHLLERHGLGKVLFETIKEDLAEAGLILKEGTIMDASIIMKLPIGVDDQTGVAHRLAPPAANVHDLVPSEELLHGEEERVWEMLGIRGWRSGKGIRIGKWPGTLP